MKQPFRQTKFKLVYLFEEKYCAVWRLRPYKISPLKEDSAGFLRGKKLITSKWSTTAKFCEDFSTLLSVQKRFLKFMRILNKFPMGGSVLLMVIVF